MFYLVLIKERIAIKRLDKNMYWFLKIQSQINIHGYMSLNSYIAK